MSYAIYASSIQITTSGVRSWMGKVISLALRAYLRASFKQRSSRSHAQRGSTQWTCKRIFAKTARMVSSQPKSNRLDVRIAL